MTQHSRRIPVKMLDGSIRDGQTNGPCVTWLCTCEREMPMLGCTHGYHHLKEEMMVECPLCYKMYEVRPDEEKPDRVVQSVEERKRKRRPPPID